MFLNRRNLYLQQYPYISPYTQAQIQQYRATAAKIQALREAAALEAQLQDQARAESGVTFIGGTQLESRCVTPTNTQDFVPCGHVSRPGSTPQSYSLWGSSEDSQTASNENLHRKRFNKSLCRVVTGCAIMLVILALLGIVGIAVYLGFFSKAEDVPNNTAKYVGNMHVLQGDSWVPALNFKSSPPFRAKATKYKNMLKDVYNQSSLGVALEDIEVIKFNKMKPELVGFEVSFVLNLDRRKIPPWSFSTIDIELKNILLQELRSVSPVSFRNFEVDRTSIDIKKFESNLDIEPKDKFELVTVGGLGTILRVKPINSQSAIQQQKVQIMTTEQTSDVTTKSLTTSSKIMTTNKPSTLKNVVYENGPWTPLNIPDNKNEFNLTKEINNTFYHLLHIGIGDAITTDKSPSSSFQLATNRVTTKKPTRTTIRVRPFTATTNSTKGTEPVTTLAPTLAATTAMIHMLLSKTTTDQESEAVEGFQVFHNFLKNLLENLEFENQSNPDLDRMGDGLTTMQAPAKENVIEELNPSREDIQSVIENLLYMATLTPETLAFLEEFNNVYLEGKTDDEDNTENVYYKEPTPTSSFTTSYSGVRDFFIPISTPTVSPMNDFHIHTPTTPTIRPTFAAPDPIQLSIWDVLTTKKPLILDTEVVTSTSYNIRYGHTNEELRPVYIRSTTIPTLNLIGNTTEFTDDISSRFAIPVISGKEVRYVTINRTRSNYPNVVVVNIPTIPGNEVPIRHRKDRKLRFDDDFLRNVSTLADYFAHIRLGNLKSGGKLKNFDAEFPHDGKLNYSIPNITLLWTLFSKISKAYLSDPSILQQLQEFPSLSDIRQTLPFFSNESKELNSTTSGHYSNGETKMKSGKSLKSRPLTTVFIFGKEEGKRGNVVSVSSRYPKLAEDSFVGNSPIRRFTFKEDQSLDDLLSEIFDELSSGSRYQYDREANPWIITAEQSESNSHSQNTSKSDLSSSFVPAGEDSWKIVEELSKLLSDYHENYNSIFGESSVEKEVTTSAFEEEIVTTNASNAGFEYSNISLIDNINEVDSTTKKSVIVGNATKFGPTTHKYLHELIPVMTRPMHPIRTSSPSYSLENETISAVDALHSINSFEVNTIPTSIDIYKNCSEVFFKCSDGKCIPQSAYCNMINDCNDKSDEKNCKCSDILKSQHFGVKICDGIIDCWDKSDETNCDWCEPGHFICTGTRKCVKPEKVCDAFPDCPNGDDERDCVTISPSILTANSIDYYNEGYLMVRKNGRWGKLCMDRFEETISKSHVSWSVADLGEAVCKTLTFDAVNEIEKEVDGTPPLSRSVANPYYEINITQGLYPLSRTRTIGKRSLSYHFKLNDPFILPNAASLEVNARSKRDATDLSLQFQETECSKKEVVKVKCSDLLCGIRPRATTLQARIVGGSNSSPGAWPWHAALYKEGEYQCGATVISHDWLISAGHCFYGATMEYWVARMGALRRGTKFPSPFEQVRRITHIFIHPEYVNQGFINDISLLKLDTSINLNDYVRPVCLPHPTSEVSDGRRCTLVGWGQLFEVKKVFPDTLQEVEVPLISTNECRKRTLFLPLYRITEDMFCAGYDRGGRDACLGDSGGPLMCQKTDGNWEVVGVTSNGYGCARPHRPGVYTKIVNYLPWINQVMKLGSSSRVVRIQKECEGHRCPLGECLPISDYCDGKVDCSDGSDEQNCPS